MRPGPAVPRGTPGTSATRSDGGSPGRAGWLRPALLVLLLGAAVTGAAVVGVPDTAALRADVEGLGPAGPPVFVLLYAAATLLPLPRNVLSAAAGLLFGFVQGVLVVLPGALLGALAGFGLGRALGRGAVERFTGTRVARVDALLARRGFVAVLVARVVPVVPFTGVNYAAGLTAIRSGSFAVGTALGIVPGTVAYVALGAYGTSPASWPFLVAVAALAGPAGLGWALARRRPGRLPSRRGRARRPVDRAS
ncbi:TVP38/TMEM64 family protein [Geodermatophilus sp. YIM 151500]|uniref:TVP38/TMEM64 family protein n=1 Tax=Geodermatophilus sp. YIM 151500 TaxID=2984531 RepID=UPI0021E3AE04|nr:TVP38/TMEM64 family protein [Geodermatophilus sp. YIM 151500]MCV2490525.1 TVP38/TMEM64 family protein [Geodermatophilus sp. YIM 151500]